MWTSILTILKNKYFLLAVLIICLIISGGITYKNIYNTGYKQGIIYQQGVYNAAVTKQTEEDKKLQKVADQDRDNLNNQIVSLKGELAASQAQNAKNKQTIQEQVNQYAKSNKNTTAVCISSNDDGLRILNKSFPSSK